MRLEINCLQRLYKLRQCAETLGGSELCPGWTLFWAAGRERGRRARGAAAAQNSRHKDGDGNEGTPSSACRHVTATVTTCVGPCRAAY